MFTGFNLKLCKEEFENIIREEGKSLSYYKEIGEEHLSAKKANFKENIEHYIDSGVADGTKIEDDWFPKVEADIFISHAHKDEELALALSGWMHEKFQVDCFIDSCVWGYVDDLLESINSVYSNKRESSDGGYLYTHAKCNTASKHVDVMLCIALQKMIDKVETTFVINTDTSISKYKDIYQNATFSPWIYSEIVCTQIVRKQSLSKYRKEELIVKGIYESFNQKEDEYKAMYQVSLDHLQNIGQEELNNWKLKWNMVKNKKNRYSLDELYKLTIPEKMEKVIQFHKDENHIILG